MKPKCWVKTGYLKPCVWSRHSVADLLWRERHNVKKLRTGMYWIYPYQIQTKDIT